MQRSRRLAIVVGLVFGLADSAHGQELSALPADSLLAALQPGASIRIAAPGYGKGLFTARVVTLHDGLLEVRTSNRSQVSRISSDSVTRLQVVRGMQNRARTWGIRGAALGAAVGTFVGAAAGDIYEPECAAEDFGCGINKGFQHSLGQMGKGALLGAILGGIVGGVIGTNTHGPRWRDVAPSALHSLRVGLGTQTSVGWALTF